MRITALLLCAVLVSLTAGPSAIAQDMPESSPVALNHHAQGVASYVNGDWDEAIDHFYQAFESDPTSYVSLFVAALCHSNAGRGDQADSLYAIVAQHKDRLSPYYRYRLEGQIASRAGDFEAAIEATRQAAQVAPGTKAAYNLALLVGPRNRPAEARDALRTLDPTREPMRGWYPYFSVYTSAAHALGDYEDELRVARQGRELYPEDIRTARDQAVASAALGQVTDLARILEKVESMPASGAVDAGDVLVQVGQELAAHGRAGDARRYLERAMAWYDDRPSNERETEGWRSGKGYALYSAGRYEDAASLYHALAREFPENGFYEAWPGYLAALTSDGATATEVSRKIQAGEVPLSTVNRAIFRALIAAALGEREQAVTLFKESGVRAQWMHRDPVLRRTIMEMPEFLAFLKPEG